MEEREILLPLEREYTKDEQIGLLKQQNQNLIDQLNNGRLVNQYLKNRVSTLNTAIYLADKRVDEARLKLAKEVKENQKLQEAHNELHDQYDMYKLHMKNTVINQVKRKRRPKQ